MRDKAFGSASGRRFASWTRAQPRLAELRDQYGGPHLSDEELLLRYLVPAEDLERARAAGPLTPHYVDDAVSMKEMLDHLLTLQRPRHVSISRGSERLTLSR